ncbi:hypothetical protein A3E39_01200 [Candidatus Uhrbacteria bacterium RIFCSPHIGHO2_12_FULL_60_25]|uniref:Carbohydrate kinase PfkB domain-containing protein n=1 Tax=Candidatus Uhrbacteria bacterium RIFCSPHIGHO2_12_FULL_60_25 TaxID=1802399 RepID=A0A1F7UKE7_9BACT|nr:MAG: hypothetical protein A3D73_02285 [Candidatus Uhrbacteria bacterium RIFCSPHIGHO2_02_FULL_60_44]OGL78760.1 MAG: hypothetical protein A3E39_01200 [Candidatus Uhrbacteria bacterium RIFCSPHIGHO2_12_FULL_60_25]
MIGDAPRDMIAARDAGIPRRIMLGTADASEATDRVTTMDEACRLIMPSASSATHRLDRYPEETRAFLQEFQERYRADDVIRRIERIRPLKVLLIGDAVIDEYCYVRPMGKTSKANIIASRILNDEAFIGGIFACANHVAGFCDTVHVVTGLGLTDTKETFIRDHLKTNVTMKAIYRKGVPTTVKRRYVDSNFLAKLFEVYRFDDGALHADQEAELHAYLLTVLPQYDVVICLDYLHGLISSRTVELLASQSAFLAVNTQTNAANIGYNPITRYPNADYICIDEPELRLATLDRFGPIDPLLVSVAERLSCPKAIATRGHHGCLTFEAGTGLQSIPVLSQNVVDAVGAGDAFLAVTAPCAAAGMPMDLVGFIGNIVGSRAVMIVGNRETVDFPSVVAAIHSILA